MALHLDLDDDHEVFDGRESVIVRLFGARTVTAAGVASAPSTDVAVSSALRRQIDVREVESSGGKLRLDDVVWELPQEQLAQRPNAGDLVIAGSENWKILRVDDATLRSRWRAFARLE